MGRQQFCGKSEQIHKNYQKKRKLEKKQQELSKAGIGFKRGITQKAEPNSNLKEES